MGCLREIALHLRFGWQPRNLVIRGEDALCGFEALMEREDG